MAGLTDYDCEGTLTIGSVSMNRPAWAIQGSENGEGGLLNLITTVEQRGEDRILPNALGVIPYRRRVTKTEHNLRLVVVGEVDQAGAPVADHTQGLAANLSYIYANVVAPTGTTDGTRSATLAIPGLASRTAAIHVVKLVPREYYLGEHAVFVGTLTISIPSGRFT